MHNLFISHAWHRSEHYEKIVEWLDESDIEYRNYSVTEENPLHSGNKTELKNDLTDQIRPAGEVLILAGMYVAHSDWIEYEINEAVRMGKYVIGVEPWGQERVPTIVQNNADIMVGWNSSSVVNAIKILNHS